MMVDFEHIALTAMTAEDIIGNEAFSICIDHVPESQYEPPEEIEVMGRAGGKFRIRPDIVTWYRGSQQIFMVIASADFIPPFREGLYDKIAGIQKFAAESLHASFTVVVPAHMRRAVEEFFAAGGISGVEVRGLKVMRA